jgi:hypothetical protein
MMQIPKIPNFSKAKSSQKTDRKKERNSLQRQIDLMGTKPAMIDCQR